MKSLGWGFVEVLALRLEPAERECVLGDLIETQETAWRGIREILGLLLRRQLQCWRSWQAWLAAPGLAFPCSLMLMGFSFAITAELRDHFMSGARLSFSPSGVGQAAAILCQVLVLLICSWAAGFTVESLSRRTFMMSALCCFLPCLFCLVRFHHASLPRLCLLLFLLPAIAGVRFSRRGALIRQGWAFTLAVASTISMAALAIRGNFWAFNWGLVAPAWYLAFLSVRPGAMPTLGVEGTIR